MATLVLDTKQPNNPGGVADVLKLEYLLDATSDTNSSSHGSLLELLIHRTYKLVTIRTTYTSI